MRLLHTGDWHLGRQFHNQSLLEDQRHVLQQLISLVEKRDVDVVLVAGDIYDRSVPPAAAVALLDEVLDQICLKLDVPVIMISGNHDGAERLGFATGQMAHAGLHIVTRLNDQPEPILLGEGEDRVAFYPIPYLEPLSVRQQFGVEVASHDDAMAFVTGLLRERLNPAYSSVVLSHCFLAGGEASESERPLAVGGVDSVSPQHFMGFDYVALGHLHAPQWRTSEQIRYAGSLLKYSFSEHRQKKSVTLVDLGRDGVTSIEQLALKPRHDVRILEGELASLLDIGREDPNHQDYLLVRLSDTHAILDIMGKLREVYPNVLHLERPGLLPSGDRQTLQRDQLQRGELAMVRDFYAQTRGESLSGEQEAVIAELLQQIHRGERS